MTAAPTGDGEGVTTMAAFVARAAQACGGLPELRRRLGVSSAALASMSTSTAPLPADRLELLERLLQLEPATDPE